MVLLRTGMSGSKLAKVVGRDESTIRDWRDQVLAMLCDHGVALPGAARPVRTADELAEYLRARAEADPGEYVIIDGTHSPASRPKGWEAQADAYYWKAHTHAARATVVTDPDGVPVWFEAEPSGRGKPNDLPMLRTQALFGVLALAGVTVLADAGYVGLSKDLDQEVWTPRPRRRGVRRSDHQRRQDRAVATARIHVEHGIARLKRWEVMGRFRRDRRTYDELGRALVALERIR